MTDEKTSFHCRLRTTTTTTTYSSIQSNNLKRYANNKIRFIFIDSGEFQFLNREQKKKAKTQNNQMEQCFVVYF